MIQLSIVTPDQRVYEGQVTEATFPGAEGSFQVLKNHAPIVSALTKGTVSYTSLDGKKSSLIIDGGVVEVKDNIIVLLAEKVVV